MMERPILFSAPMVRALLDGTKTQTRRLVKGAPDDWAPVQPEVYSPTAVNRHGDEQPGPDAYGAGNADGDCWISCPYGQPGDRLWVREAWRTTSAWDLTPPRDLPGRVDLHYEADGRPNAHFCFGKLRPGMFMPRAASRITLEVTGVRVERLQDISTTDAIAEGIGHTDTEAAVADYAALWDRINGPSSWASNPWVWVVEFRKAHNV